MSGTNPAKKVMEFMSSWSNNSHMMAASETIKNECKGKSSSTPIRLPCASGGPCMPFVMGTGEIKKVKREAQESV